MADTYYGVAKGGKMPTEVTKASSTTGLAVELRISDTIWADPLLAQLAVEAIKNYLQTKESHPIA